MLTTDNHKFITHFKDQKVMKKTFNYSGFKAIFNLHESETIRRRSISERLSKIDSNYFKEILECLYDRFSESYNQPERDKYNLIRVDSTIDTDLSGKLKEGIDQNNVKKLIKFRVSFDGNLPIGLEIFNTQSYVYQKNAVSEAVLKQVKKRY